MSERLPLVEGKYMSMTTEEICRAHQLLEQPYRDVFQPSELERFGQARAGCLGFYDEEKVVQWTVSVECGNYGALISYLVVNLEGMKYEKHERNRFASWPVARLIRREQREPKLFEKIAEARRSKIECNKIKVCWWRDAWAGAVRPSIQDQDHCILCAYLSELELAQEQWLEALEDALACLDATKNYHGRAKQLVTLKDGPKELEVSPHLQFRWELSSYLQFPPEEWQADQRTAEKLRAGMEWGQKQLQPFYEWVMTAARR